LLFRTRLRHLALTGAALATVVAALPPAAAADSRDRHPSGGGLSAVIRYTEHGGECCANGVEVRRAASVEPGPAPAGVPLLHSGAHTARSRPSQ
jgi:hypothetical protein